MPYNLFVLVKWILYAQIVFIDLCKHCYSCGSITDGCYKGAGPDAQFFAEKRTEIALAWQHLLML